MRREEQKQANLQEEEEEEEEEFDEEVDVELIKIKVADSAKISDTFVALNTQQRIFFQSLWTEYVEN